MAAVILQYGPWKRMVSQAWGLTVVGIQAGDPTPTYRSVSMNGYANPGDGHLAALVATKLDLYRFWQV
jgi:hypothetical protein